MQNVLFVSPTLCILQHHFVCYSSQQWMTMLSSCPISFQSYQEPQYTFGPHSNIGSFHFIAGPLHNIAAGQICAHMAIFFVTWIKEFCILYICISGSCTISLLQELWFKRSTSKSSSSYTSYLHITFLLWNMYFSIMDHLHHPRLSDIVIHFWPEKLANLVFCVPFVLNWVNSTGKIKRKL